MTADDRPDLVTILERLNALGWDYTCERDLATGEARTIIRWSTLIAPLAGPVAEVDLTTVATNPTDSAAEALALAELIAERNAS